MISPVVKTLRVAIDNQNPAQQVILLNLLKVILFENETYFFKSDMTDKDPFKHSAIRLFSNTQDKQSILMRKRREFLVDCIKDGMQNEDAFVRYHYIQFAQKLVPFIELVLPVSEFPDHVNTFIQCFCELLNQADVSEY